MLHLRAATAADVPALQACAEQAYARYISRIGRRPAPMDADFAALVGRRQVVVAEYDGGLAGYVVTVLCDDHLHVENIAVLPGLQGMGVGSRLLHHAEQAAREAGRESVVLYTNAAMSENLAWYPGHGYAVTGRRMENGFDRVFFCKTLAAAG